MLWYKPWGLLDTLAELGIELGGFRRQVQPGKVRRLLFQGGLRTEDTGIQDGTGPLTPAFQVASYGTVGRVSIYVAHYFASVAHDSVSEHKSHGAVGYDFKRRGQSIRPERP